MTNSQGSSSVNDLSGSVPQEVVERRLNVCKDYQTEIRSVEFSTTALIAVLALYTAIFSNVGLSLNLEDFTNLGTKIIMIGLISWISSFSLLIWLDIFLSREITYLTELLDKHEYGVELPSASSFLRSNYSNKFLYMVLATKTLGRISPILLLVGIAGLYNGGVIIMLIFIFFIFFPLGFLVWSHFISSGDLYRSVKMFGWKRSVMSPLREFSRHLRGLLEYIHGKIKKFRASLLRLILGEL